MFKRLMTFLLGLGLIGLGVFLFMASEQAYAVQWVKQFWPGFLVLAGLVRLTGYLIERNPVSPVGSVWLISIGAIWLAVNWRGETSLAIILGHYWFWLLLAYVTARLLRQYLHRPQNGPVVRAFSPGGICLMLLLTVTGLSANYVNRTQQFLASLNLAQGPLFEGGTFGFSTPIKIEDDAPQSFKLLANNLLQIDQLNGDLEIRPGNSAQVVAHLTKFVRTKDEASARVAAQNVRLQISPGDRTIQLGVNTETTSEAVTVSLLLELPRQTTVKVAINSASGHVRLTDLRGEQTIQNCGKLTVNRHNGRLTISGVRGPVSLRNTQGDVILTDLQNGAELDDIEGFITLATHSGVYRLKNIKGGIRGSFSNGRLELAGIEARAQAAQAERVVNLDEVRDARVQMNEISGNIFIKAEHSRIEAGAITGDVEINANAELVKLNQLAGNLRINVANGSIAVSDIEGTAWLEATRDISVQNFAGPLNIKSHSGKIRLSNKRELHGDVIVQNEHGVTNVSLPKDIPFRLDAVSQTGRVLTRGFSTLEKATEEGEPAPLLSLHSATGNIEVQAAGLALASNNHD